MGNQIIDIKLLGNQKYKPSQINKSTDNIATQTQQKMLSNKKLSLLYRFSNQKLQQYVYSNGKSILSLSQMIGGNNNYIDPFMNNFYIKEHTQHQYRHEQKLTKQALAKQEILLKSVIDKAMIVRCILAPEISRKQMNLNINKLKSNPLLNHLINLQDKNKFKLSAPRILINSYVHVDQARQILQSQSQSTSPSKQSSLPVHKAKHGSDTSKQQLWVNKGYLIDEVEQHMKKNIMELQKLCVDGLNLDVSYVLSKRNLHHEIKNGQKDKRNLWLNCISKKSKAINSNIVQNGLNFTNTLYEQGHKMHHVFLSSYNQQKQKITSLQHNKAYSLKEVIYVMNAINFNGKIVLDCQDPNNGTEQQFVRNVEYLDRVLKDMGYKKTLLEEIDDQSYISAL